MILIDNFEWNPIAFVDQLVVAIQEDLKTETRRIIGNAPHGCEGSCWTYEPGFAAFEPEPNRIVRAKCPYGKPGGRLWVRERFVALELRGNDLKQCKIVDADCVAFRDGSRRWKDGKQFELPPLNLDGFKWRPPMHLPFWASRIALETTAIEIERLHQITEAGAVGEGFKLRVIPGYEHLTGVPAREDFITKWNEINGKRKNKKTGFKYTWENNPFVWVIKFKRIKSDDEPRTDNRTASQVESDSRSLTS